MTLAETLYRSRVWTKQGRFLTVDWEGPVADLVRTLEAECAARGLTLARWQANGANRSTTITWAVLRPGVTRRGQFRYHTDDEVLDAFRLHAVEGSTRRCEAYHELSRMLGVVLDEPLVN